MGCGRDALIVENESFDGDPEHIHLLATGDDAVIDVGEHHDRLSHECGIEDRLAGAEEVAAVDKGQETRMN